VFCFEPVLILVFSIAKVAVLVLAGSVNEKHIITIAVFLKYYNAGRNTGTVKQDYPVFTINWWGNTFTLVENVPA